MIAKRMTITKKKKVMSKMIPGEEKYKLLAWEKFKEIQSYSVNIHYTFFIIKKLGTLIFDL